MQSCDVDRHFCTAHCAQIALRRAYKETYKETYKDTPDALGRLRVGDLNDAILIHWHLHRHRHLRKRQLV